MRRFLTICALTGAAMAAAGAWSGEGSAQGLAPGTVKLLSKNGVLVDAGSGEPYVAITSTAPGKYLIVGPATLQANFRVNLKPGENEGAASSLEILVGGKPLRRFAIRPRAGMDLWREKPDSKPAEGFGFLMEIDPGPHAYEFRFTGAERGAALMLVPASKAKHPLPSSAPLVSAKSAAAAPKPTPPAVAVRAPTPKPTPTPKSIDQIAAVTGGRGADERATRYPREVALLGGMQLPGDSTFKMDASTTLEARWGIGAGESLAWGFEIGRSHFGGLSAADPHRASQPYSLNVDVTPVIAHLTWYMPVDGTVRPYVAGGPGFVWAQSAYQTRSKSINESTFGAAADGLLGVEFDLGSSDVQEGKQKLLVEVRESWAGAGFAAHNTKNFSATQLMVGAAFKF